eukprot:664040-Amorphochlora_amoeboformis.AAC.1
MCVYTHPGVACKNNKVGCFGSRSRVNVYMNLNDQFECMQPLCIDLYRRFPFMEAYMRDTMSKQQAGIVLRVVTLWSHRVTLRVVTQGDAPCGHTG